MMDKNLTNEEILMIQQLWNDQRWIYEELSEEDVVEHFERSLQRITILKVNKESLQGFISGNLDTSIHKAYLSILVVRAQDRQRAIGTELLKCFEEEILKRDPHLNSIEIVFFNPTHFRWKIDDEHFHPSAPGVDSGSDALFFFKKHGYLEYAIQDVFYKNNLNSTLNEKDIRSLNILKTEDIDITFYEEGLHQGLDDFFERMNTPLWREAALKGLNQGLPLLVVIHHNRVVGYTGPLDIDDHYRGSFEGIGILPYYRGKGIGALLFSHLVFNLSLLGAEYMSLFTGRNNHARKLYLENGFEIVHTFSNLRKVMN